MDIRSLIFDIPTLFAGQGAGAPVVPTEAPTMTFDTTVGQTATVTPVAGSNPGATLTEWRYYFDDVLDATRTGDTSALLTVDDVEQALYVGAYYAATDTELFSEPVYVPFLGATITQEPSSATVAPEITWDRAPGGGASVGDTYSIEFYDEAGDPVTLTSAVDLDDVTYTVTPDLTADTELYTWRLKSEWSGHVAYSALAAYRSTPTELLDETTTEIAVGDLAGAAATLASDGTHTRTGVDTGDDLQQTGGYATFAANAAGDPQLSYDASIARAAGKMLFFTIIPDSSVPGAPNMALGFYSAVPSGTLSLGNLQNGVAISQVSSGLQLVGFASVADYIDLLTVTEVQECCLILRTSGQYLYRKNQTDGMWYLLGWNTRSTTATLYLAVVGALINFRAGKFAIPLVARWLPTAPLSDGMSDTSATFTSDGLGQAETSGIGVGASGIDRIDVIGTFINASGTAHADTLDGGIAMSIYDLTATDYHVRAALTLGDTAETMALVFAYVDANNYAYIQMLNDGAYKYTVVEVVGGTPNPLTAASSLSVAYAAGAEFTVRKIGNKAQPYYRDREMPTGSINELTLNAVFAGACKVGVRASHASQLFDNFVMHPYGSGDEYAALSLYNKALSAAATIPLDDPPTETPLTIPVNPDSFDLLAAIASAGEGGTLTLDTQGIYTVPDEASIYEISIPADFTLNIDPGIRVVWTTEGGKPPGISFGANFTLNGTLWCGGTPNSNTKTIVFGAPGGQRFTGGGLRIFGYWNGIQIGSGKSDIQFDDFVALNCGWTFLYHAIYVAGLEAGSGEDKVVVLNNPVIVKSGSGGGAGVGIRIGHKAENVTVNGGYLARCYYAIWNDTNGGHTFDEIIIRSNVGKSQFNGDGLTLKRCLIGLGAQVSGAFTGTPTPVVDQNGYVLTQTLDDDSNPILLTLADVTTRTGYTTDQLTECEDILVAKSATIDADFWADPTLDYYIGILQAASAAWKSYQDGL